MSLQVTIEAFLDDADARAKQRELESKNEMIAEAIEANEEASRISFDKVMGAMRASYMMMSGIAQVMGTSMGEMFTTVFGVAISAIGTYEAIASAAAATGPMGWIQAGIMFASLAVAGINLAGLVVGQDLHTQQINGLIMTLQGFSQMIGSFNF